MTTRQTGISILVLGCVAFLLPEAACGQAVGEIENGDFTDPSGAPWHFVDQSYNGAVDFVGGEAVITGGNDGISPFTGTYLEQEFHVDGQWGLSKLSFDWSYWSADPNPGYDGLFFDVRSPIGFSVIGGPLILTSQTGEMGTVEDLQFGVGTFLLQIGTWSIDNLFGPGVGTFDNVELELVSPFLSRGDCDNTGGFNLADVGYLLGFLFVLGQPASTLPCADTCDANDDGSINLQDPIAMLAHLFGQPSVPIPAPWSCGQDTSPDSLACTDYGHCP